MLNCEADWNGIEHALRKLVETALSTDSVLIYYAGHGERDLQLDDGWWIPADARAGKRQSFLDNTLVQKTMRARAMPATITDKYYLKIFNDKSRWGMTFGGDEPVADLGGGGHSVFTGQPLKTLRRNIKPYLSAYEIFRTVVPVVMDETEQKPECRPIRGTGGDRGEFVFVTTASSSRHPGSVPKI
ncbi:caspase family protein [Desulfococcaceae bacterium HSG9]|nr:caspase family protein [Desulfococcaceae bacterium HSG9]